MIKLKNHREVEVEALTSNDSLKYLAHGKLSMSFLKDEFVKERIRSDYEVKRQNNHLHTMIESLLSYIHSKLSFEEKMEIRQNLQFQRSAKEIWESGKCVGCTDWALVFAVFSRQLGIPTTYLHTVEEGCLKNIQLNQKCSHIGHTFCECFYQGKWILVDPTKKKIEWEYNIDKLKLNYLVGGYNVFIPYFRGLDLGERQSIKEHNQWMKCQCKKLNLEN